MKNFLANVGGMLLFCLILFLIFLILFGPTLLFGMWGFIGTVAFVILLLCLPWDN